MRSVYTTILRLVLALILAASLWVFVSFTENPQRSASFTGLPISAEGLAPATLLVDDEGLPLVLPQDSITVTVVGPEDALNTINKQNIQPYINLVGLTPGTHVVPVNIRSVALPNQLELAFPLVQPGQINVVIEPLITTTVPLNVLTVGQPPSSYEISAPVTQVSNAPQRTVTVQGPASQVKRVLAGEVEIDLNGQTSDINVSRQISPVDAAGRAVRGVVVVPELVQVKVSIRSSSGIKRVPVVAVVRDQPAPGLRPLIRLDPAFVTLVGSSRALTAVEFIETQPIELLGATSAFTTLVRLRFPPGITLFESEQDTEVVATVRLEPLETQYTLSLPVTPVNVQAGLQVAVRPNRLSITLKGPATSVAEGTFGLTVDLSGLGPGTYSIKPAATLPPGLALVDSLPLVIITLILPPTPIPPTAIPLPTSVPNPPQPSGTPEPTATAVPITTPTLPPTAPISPTLQPTP